MWLRFCYGCLIWPYNILVGAIIAGIEIAGGRVVWVGTPGGLGTQLRPGNKQIFIKAQFVIT